MASGGTVPSDLAAGVLAGDRTAIGQAITLVESVLPEHRVEAAALLDELLPHSGDAHRVGITGVPGVGKSTFIEALGLQLTGASHRVAVLAVDPSSSRTGGSILGDKTRMAQLSVDPDAFIRPSPSAGTLGGVTRATREAMIVLEAAGHDVMLVETVGVGTLVDRILDLPSWLAPEWLVGWMADVPEPLFTKLAVVLGLVYSFLPFMILPLYASIERIDPALLEASRDLYANGRQSFRRVLLPLSMPGVIAGSILVFVPSLGAYVTPDILGGGKEVLLGSYIVTQFGTARNFPFGASLSVVLMVVMLTATIGYFRSGGRNL